MFVQLSALVALLPLAGALTVDTPTNVHSSGPVTLTWTTSAGDPDTFSFELVNTDIFHNAFAIANNVQPSLQTLNVSLPVVPAGPGYTLQAVNITNINQVFAQSGPFNVEDAISTTSSSALSTSASLTASSATGASVTTPVGASSTSGFGTVISPSASSAASNAVSNTGSGSATSDGPAPTTFNGNGNGAAAMGYGSWAAMALAAAAGAAAAL